MSKIIIEARVLAMYPLGKPGFRGGTETYVERLAHGLAQNHHVHVVCRDLDQEEQRGPTEWWWGPDNFPTRADVVVAVHNLTMIEPYTADVLVLAANGVDPMLLPDGPTGFGVDAVACFSKVHADLLCQTRPSVPRDRCVVTGLGVDLAEYPKMIDPINTPWIVTKDGTGPAYDTAYPKVPGRMLYANDPARGLWHTLDVFDEVKKRVEGATLHVAYDFDRQFEHHRWEANWLAETLWDCKRRIETTPGVVNLGQLSREDLVREQLECAVHVMPSDPPNLGSQIHGILQAEMAAAGTPLVLSRTEAFDEVFGSAALILPLPGTFLPAIQRRYDAGDWAQAVVELMRDEQRWGEMSLASRALAETMTWAHVVDRWEAMLADLVAHPPTSAVQPEAVPA